MFLGNHEKWKWGNDALGFLFACEAPSERPVQSPRLWRTLNRKAVSTCQRQETSTCQQQVKFACVGFVFFSKEKKKKKRQRQTTTTVTFTAYRRLQHWKNWCFKRILNFLYSFFFCVASVLGILHNLKEKVSVAFNPALRNINPPSWTGQCSISPPGSTSRWPSGTLSSTWSGCVSAVAHCCPLATARLIKKAKQGQGFFWLSGRSAGVVLGKTPSDTPRHFHMRQPLMWPRRPSSVASWQSLWNLLGPVIGLQGH